ncbi:MAG: hypothetical protein LBK29_00785 [Oscillospiraceae bacterium]|jgi:hypothetical protein|nr:hypothetical protein [Oscillospiraceae bacterium]
MMENAIKTSGIIFASLRRFMALLSFICLMFSTINFMVPCGISADNPTPNDLWSNYCTEITINTGEITEIKTPGEFAFVALQLGNYASSISNFNDSQYRYCTFKLMNDLDMGAHYWQPTCLPPDVTFDGNGKTIKNVIIDEYNMSGIMGFYYNHFYFDQVTELDEKFRSPNFGLFGTVIGSTIRNLRLEDPILDISRYYSSSKSGSFGSNFSPWGGDIKPLYAGVLCGVALRSQIYNVEIKNPRISGIFSGLYSVPVSPKIPNDHIGFAIGHVGASNAGLNGNPSESAAMSVLSAVDVIDGKISIDDTCPNMIVNSFFSSETNSAYVGGIAGSCYSSGICSCSVKGDSEIKLNKRGPSTNYVGYPKECWIDKLNVGGIVGYTSSDETPDLGTETCVLNNLCVTEFSIDDDIAEILYKGTIAGEVRNDSVVNNLYIGSDNDLDFYPFQGKFGHIENKNDGDITFLIDNNFSYEGAKEAYDDGVYDKLGGISPSSDGNSENDGGFYKLLQVIRDHSGIDLLSDMMLTSFRVWVADENRPALGAYYSYAEEPGVWVDKQGEIVESSSEILEKEKNGEVTYKPSVEWTIGKKYGLASPSSSLFASFIIWADAGITNIFSPDTDLSLIYPYFYWIASTDEGKTWYKLGTDPEGVFVLKNGDPYEITANSAMDGAMLRRVAGAPVGQDGKYLGEGHIGLLPDSLSNIVTIKIAKEAISEIPKESEEPENLIFDQTDPITGVRVTSDLEAFPAGSVLKVEPLYTGTKQYNEAYEKLDDQFKNKMENIIIYDLSIADEKGEVLDISGPGTERTCHIPIPAGFDADEVLAIYVSAFSDEIKAAQTYQDSNGQWFIKFVTDHFSPFAVYDPLIVKNEVQNPKTSDRMKLKFISFGIITVLFVVSGIAILILLKRKEDYEY